MNNFAKFLILAIFILVSACAQQSQPETPENEALGNIPAAPTKGDWWKPAPGTSWQIQLSGTVDTSFDVQVYDIDLFDVDAQVIENLHGQGRKVICYFSAGSHEDWRPDAADFPKEILGKDYEGWEGERWLDIRQIDKLSPIMQKRLDLAVQKKCDAVDPDNVEGYAVDSGFPLSDADQLKFNRWLAAEAHRRGLAIGLKNDLGQINELVGDFDFAINEECFEVGECQELLPFIAAGKPVFGIEYTLNTAAFCSQANQMNFDTLKKDLELGAKRESCR